MALFGLLDIQNFLEAASRQGHFYSFFFLIQLRLFNPRLSTSSKNIPTVLILDTVGQCSKRDCGKLNPRMNEELIFCFMRRI